MRIVSENQETCKAPSLESCPKSQTKGLKPSALSQTVIASFVAMTLALSGLGYAAIYTDYPGSIDFQVSPGNLSFKIQGKSK